MATLPPVMPQPPVRAVAVAAVDDDGRPQVVGGVRIGPSPVEQGGGREPKKRGRDGPGVKHVRTCKRCKEHGEVWQGQHCKGRSKFGAAACEYFREDSDAEDEPEFAEEFAE